MSHFPKIDSSINIIGPQASGKTTYLAVLAYHATKLKEKIPQFNILSDNPEAEYLSDIVQDIILADLDDNNKRKRIAPTDSKKTPKQFQFKIYIPSFIKEKSTSLYVKDYSGELFQQVGKKVSKNESLYDYLPQNVKSFIDDLLESQNWMIVLSDWRREEYEKTEKDVEYKNSILNLLEELNTWESYEANKNRPKKRIALVMAKCERGELWSGRLDPEEDIFQLRFPKTYEILVQRKYSPNRINFFACSSYGVLGNKDPRPNRVIPDESSSATRAYLRQEESWEPYGLFSPIYWLITGKRLADYSI